MLNRRGYLGRIRRVCALVLLARSLLVTQQRSLRRSACRRALSLIELVPRFLGTLTLAQIIARRCGNSFGEQHDCSYGFASSPDQGGKLGAWRALTNFKLGTLYIVEFWPTWCGGCGAEISHLAQLQEKYDHSAVEVIAVAASERGSTAEEARTKLDAWLTKKGSKLNVRIAFDYAGTMKKCWMAPSLSSTIPTLIRHRP
ncbi:thiol-disulfide isomerase/thioredoxin [Bradyrhizobium sp. S3.3.6]|uniref:TlpA disulfide reductase family protein n=1 Tax=Bradyrhizobium sp. S3.3.6 TaxID=3156429 RepID=UPI003392E0F5